MKLFNTKPGNKPPKPIEPKLDPKPKQSRSLIFGSGVTKRKSEQAAKAFEQSLNRSSHTDVSEDEITFEFQADDLTKLIKDDSQELAVNESIYEKYAVIFGSAGTGKTTVQIRIIQAIEHMVETHRKDKSKPSTLKIGFVAFMGKAVQPMKKRLDIKYHPLCGTIHATLGYAPVKEKGKRVFRPYFCELRKLNFDIIVLDEAGTTPIYLFNELVAALPAHCRLFMFGDLNQLPPVTGRSILGFAMLTWPCFELSTIHRQALDNPIIANATKILKGKRPIPDAQNFQIMKIDESSKIAPGQIKAVVQKLHSIGKFDPLNDALIVPTNGGDMGQETLNESLVHYFNPLTKNENNEYSNPRTVIHTGKGKVVFACGDKIMLTKNITNKGLTNGMVGIVTDIAINGAYRKEIDTTPPDLTAFMSNMDLTVDIDNADDDDTNDRLVPEEEPTERQASHIITVQFQDVKDKMTFTSSGDFSNIKLAYAFTCHKSQGSEYNTVIVVLHNSTVSMLSREWFYTAVTRAKVNVVLLVTDYAMSKALTTQRIKGRTAKEKAKSFLALQKGDNIQPDLHEAEKWTY